MGNHSCDVVGTFSADCKHKQGEYTYTTIVFTVVILDTRKPQ